MSRDADLKKLIELNHRRLAQLKKQQAMMGTSTPTEVRLEIEDVETQIQKLASELDDAPPPISGDIFQVLGDDVVYGGKVSGDKVVGDKITLSEVSGTASVFGRTAQQIARQSDPGLSSDRLALLFFPVYDAIQSRADDPDVKKHELRTQIEKIEHELHQGDEVDPDRLLRLLRILYSMADDIFRITVTTLTDRAAPVPGVVRKMAQKAQEIWGDAEV